MSAVSTDYHRTALRADLARDAYRAAVFAGLNPFARFADTLAMSARKTAITNWDDYFYEIAEVVARRSKDNPKVGAVIARETDHILLSSGYNGPARDVLDLTSRLKPKKGKLAWMCHAETNAIYNAVRSGAALAGGTIYVTKFPCVMCASAIIQAGLVRLFTRDDDAWRKDPYDDGYGTISHTILSEGGITLHTPAFIRKLTRARRGPMPQFAQGPATRSVDRSGTTTSNSRRRTNGSPGGSKGRGHSRRVASPR